MKLHQVPASAGLQWVKAGLRTFVRQPLALTGLFFLYLMLVSLLAMVPWVGLALGLALLPAATLGLMVAAREIQAGRFPMPAVLASAFRGERKRVQGMWQLGGLYALGSVLAMLLTAWLVGSDTPLPSADSANDTWLQDHPEWLLQWGVSLLLHFPLALLFWHAPALVHWHGIPAGKSLFFSLLACWQNRWALTVFLLGWGLVFGAISVVLVFVVGLIGGQAGVALLAFPLAMVMSAAFFASLYFTFRDSFRTDDDQPAA